MNTVMNGEDFLIEKFCPHCLIAAMGAIAGYKYNINNLNCLFFHHSYLYYKEMDLNIDRIGCVNIEFTRELPLQLEEFERRLTYYYGLNLFYQEFSNFESLMNDMQYIINQGEPVILEVDLYFWRNHLFFQNRHEQHVVVVYGMSQNSFLTVDSILGKSEILFDDYAGYMKWAQNNDNRQINILGVDRTNVIKRRISLMWGIEDIERCLENMNQSHSNMGLKALKNFSADLLSFIKKEQSAKRIIVPGSWAFMCDTMTCAKWLKEFMESYSADTFQIMRKTRELCIKIGRYWYALSSYLYSYGGNYNDINHYLVKIYEYEKQLNLSMVDCHKAISDFIQKSD